MLSISLDPQHHCETKITTGVITCIFLMTNLSSEEILSSQGQMHSKWKLAHHPLQWLSH